MGDRNDSDGQHPLGTLVSGYVYRFNNSLPWIILSISMVVLGAAIIVLIKDPEA